MKFLLFESASLSLSPLQLLFLLLKQQNGSLDVLCSNWVLLLLIITTGGTYFHMLADQHLASVQTSMTLLNHWVQISREVRWTTLLMPQLPPRTKCTRMQHVVHDTHLYVLEENRRQPIILYIRKYEENIRNYKRFWKHMVYQTAEQKQTGE